MDYKKLLEGRFNIEIVNLNKWNPPIKKNRFWIKLSTSFYSDPKILQLSDSEIVFFQKLLITSAQNPSNFRGSSLEVLRKFTQSSGKHLAKFLAKLLKLQLIVITKHEDNIKKTSDIIELELEVELKKSKKKKEIIHRELISPEKPPPEKPPEKIPEKPTPEVPPIAAASPPLRTPPASEPVIDFGLPFFDQPDFKPDFLEPDTPVPKQPERKKSGKPFKGFGPRIDGIVRFYCAAHAEKYGGSVLVTNAEKAAIKRILQAIEDPEEVKNLINKYLAMDDSWFKTKAHDIRTLEINLTKIQSAQGKVKKKWDVSYDE